MLKINLYRNHHIMGLMPTCVTKDLVLHEYRELDIDKGFSDLVGDITINALFESLLCVSAHDDYQIYRYAGLRHYPCALFTLFGYDSLGQGFIIPSFRADMGRRLNGQYINNYVGSGSDINRAELPYDYPEIPWLAEYSPVFDFKATPDLTAPQHHTEVFKWLVDTWFVPAIAAVPAEVFESRLRSLIADNERTVISRIHFDYAYRAKQITRRDDASQNGKITLAARAGWLPDHPDLYRRKTITDFELESVTSTPQYDWA